MGEVTGKLKICDRCKTEVFLRLKGKNSSIVDGEFLTRGEFENPPAGWTYNSVVGVLCPDCNKEYSILINSFLNNKHSEGDL